MNLTDFLLMKNGNTVKPDADLFDILLAKKMGSAGVLTTIIGNPLSFFASNAQKAISTKITMNPIQEGSGDPSPENVRPISGRTGVRLDGCGKNLFDSEIFDTHIESSIRYIAYKVPNGVYTMSTPDFPIGLSNTVNVFFLAGNVSSGASSSYNGVSSSKNITITVIDGFYTVAYRSTAASNQNDPKDFKWQIEMNSTATAYEPYQSSNAISITFPALGHNQWDEVWEVGSIDPNNGINVQSNNTIRSKNYIPVIGSITYFINSPKNNSGIYQLFLFDEDKNFIGTKDFNAIRNQLYEIPEKCKFIRFRTYAVYGTTYNNDISINYPAAYTTYEPYTNTCYSGTLDVKTGVLTVDMGYIASYNGETLTGKWISDRDVYSVETTPTIGAEVCYDLATPTTIHLTPKQVQLLKGHNTIWTDGDEIELTYMA